METVKSSAPIDVLIPLVVIVFIVAISVVLLYQHFQKNLFIHKLRQEAMKTSHQLDLLRANIQAQEEERKRIAQDLHDELGAVLSIMRMNIMMLERKGAAPSADLLPGMQNLRALTESALMSMRSISHQLMPPQLEAFGLIPTLEAVASQINKSGTLHVQLCTPVSLTSIPWETSLALYRILMELINNTIKHSGATQACIKIDEYDSCLDCNYTDNGKGIAPECKGLGLGHKSIDGRVLAAQGTFKFCSPDEGGFWASVHIPIGKQKSF